MAGAKAGAATGVAAATVSVMGSLSAQYVLPLLLLGFLVGTLGGVFFDRVSRSRDSTLFPVAFGVLGGLTGAAVMALVPVAHHFLDPLPAGTLLWTYLIALSTGGLGGALLGASAGVFAGRRDPENPLPATGRAAAIAGLGTLGFAKLMMGMGVGFSTATGPLSAALVTFAFSLHAVGAYTLGTVAALAAASGTLLAAGRQAWVEQDLGPAPVVPGNLLHDSSEGYRALLAGDDPSLY